MVHFDDIPEDIRPLILSQLPLKEAIKTSTLSQSWKHSWKYAQTYNRNLIFNYATLLGDINDVFYESNESYRISTQDVENFVKCIDIVLDHHQCVDVQSFKVEFPIERNYAFDLKKWVSFAIRSKSKVLCLTLGNLIKAGWKLDDQYVDLCRFPCELFIDEQKSGLECLRLDFVSFRLQHKYDGFKNLRKFELQVSNVTDEDMETFLSNCFLLEFLSIKSCPNLVRLLIPAMFCRLKTLCVRNCELKSIQIQAKELTNFEYDGQVIDFMITGSLHISHASICFGFDEGMSYFANRLSFDFPHLQTLYFDTYHPLQNLNIPRGHGGFNYLKTLVLFICVTESEEWEFYRFASVVNAAPLLEQFILHLECCCPENSWSLRRTEAGKPRKIPRSPHNNLKKVELTGYTCSENQVELAKYFLTTTAALEIMTIDPRERKFKKYLSPAVLSELRCKAYNDLHQDVPAHAKFIVL